MLGPDAVTVGAATLPLADFLARGGGRPVPAVTGSTVPAGAEERGAVSAQRWNHSPAKGATAEATAADAP